jgi:hypothetical protein
MQELQEAIAGYQQTHVHLIATAGQGLQAAGIGNDLGFFYFVVKLVDTFNWPLTTAIEVFLGGLITLGFIAGFIGVTRLWRQSRYYWWSVFGIAAMSVISYMVGDVYAVASAVTIGTLPYILLLLRKPVPTIKWFAGFLIIGLICGLSNSIRSYSGTTIALFGILGLGVSPIFIWTNKVKAAILICIGVALPTFFFNHLVTVRNEYLVKNQPDYIQTITAHPFWHTAYIGFGFLSNEQGITYLDQTGIDTVMSIDPTATYLTPRYEEILRGETLSLIRHQPLFALETLVAKLGLLVLLYLPFFANIGLWRAFQKRIGGRMYYPYYLTMTFAAFAGILAIPDLRYLLGFAAVALFYGFTVLNEPFNARKS